jgi:hypothetical protein
MVGVNSGSIWTAWESGVVGLAFLRSSWVGITVLQS